jgi:hypothetical protein
MDSEPWRQCGGGLKPIDMFHALPPPVDRSSEMTTLLVSCSVNFRQIGLGQSSGGLVDEIVLVTGTSLFVLNL